MVLRREEVGAKLSPPVRRELIDAGVLIISR